jgi:DNA invertase Pin-like site-specific DNA recombinase
MSPNRKTLRCALYTRKSSDEGLDQEFNSLHAQREACEAYVISQTHEGWRMLPTRYDDGGYSGGTMNRPGLQHLLADIAAGKVDVVVVYKIDRLTRSLADFARMVELFDKHGVSFVSVTQSFNTTSSMGRLTLNVLLSFAQFEREVTAERIRDRIGASKAKGMWMGGVPPLGYDLPSDKSRTLVLNEEEAETVGLIFRQYLKLGSVHELEGWLKQENIVSKRRESAAGNIIGGVPFSRGALYHLLKNEISRSDPPQGRALPSQASTYHRKAPVRQGSAHPSRQAAAPQRATDRADTCSSYGPDLRCPRRTHVPDRLARQTGQILSLLCICLVAEGWPGVLGR